jgi:V/A-type H+-transporting ATPase subunit F
MATRKDTSEDSTDAGNENNAPRTGKSSIGYQNTKQIAVMGDEDTVIGFGLAGIKYLTTVSKTTDDKEILKLINEYIDSPEIGFVLITQEIAERVRADFERLKIDKALYPIFIELPDKTGELPDRIDPIKSLIRRAIGMEIVKK